MRVELSENVEFQNVEFQSNFRSLHIFQFESPMTLENSPAPDVCRLVQIMVQGDIPRINSFQLFNLIFDSLTLSAPT